MVKTTKQPVKSKKQNNDYIATVGRRKTSVARVRLYPRKKVDWTVNSLPVADYFPGQVSKCKYEKPFVVTNILGKYSVTVKIIGGGKKSQLAAMVHGIARALDKFNRDQYHDSLKSAGLLTRDSRMRERRKAGTGGKARRQKQSPKR